MKWLPIFILFFGCIGGTRAQDIIITEIFADPTPSRGLPEIEFLELYNPEENPVSLKGYKLIYGNTQVVLPDSILPPKNYAVLVRAASVSAYQSLNIGISNLSLNNTGAVLRWLNPEGKEIQYIAYQNTWYTEGRDQGYSLEMIDLNYPCKGKENWASSKAKHGATPGAENSVAAQISDNIGPYLLATQANGNQIILFFNEVLSSDFNSDQLLIYDGDYQIHSIDFADASRTALLVTFNKKIDAPLELHLYELKDCIGNISPILKAHFQLYPEPLNGQIQISEILFNPKAGGSDFVEIHNYSNQTFNLKDWMLAHRNAQGQMASLRKISSTDFLIFPSEYWAFTTDTSHLKTTYPYTGNMKQLSSLPAYNNDQGTVFLLKPDSSVFDSFTYSEKMHAPLIHNPDGVSLEKISFEDNRWASAASNVGYATPGWPNSQHEHDNLTQEFYAEPLIFIPQEHQNVFLKYSLKQESLYASIKILDRNGNMVRNLGSNLLLGSQGQIAWDGTNQSGQLLPVGYYVFSILVYGNNVNDHYYAKTVIGAY